MMMMMMMMMMMKSFSSQPRHRTALHRRGHRLAASRAIASEEFRRQGEAGRHKHATNSVKKKQNMRRRQTQTIRSCRPQRAAILKLFAREDEALLVGSFSAHCRWQVTYAVSPFPGCATNCGRNCGSHPDWCGFAACAAVSSSSPVPAAGARAVNGCRTILLNISAVASPPSRSNPVVPWWWSEFWQGRPAGRPGRAAARPCPAPL